MEGEIVYQVDDANWPSNKSKSKDCNRSIFLLLYKILHVELFSGFENYNWSNVTITTGMFDGVHKGHLELIRFAVETSRKNHEKSLLVTYKPHPRYVVNPQDTFKLLTTYNERVKLMAETGLDGMLIIPFTQDIRQMAFSSFIEDVLVKQAGMSHYVFGYDHKLGNNRQGTFTDVQALSDKCGFNVEQFVAIHKDDVPVSSTRIREALLVGDMPHANAMLGYDYGITGKVVKGVQIGRKLGFPTANIEPEDAHKLIPGMGVYAVWVNVDGKHYKGMLNIGIRPTVHSNEEFPTIEVHLLDFEGDLYDKTITVSFMHKIREEMKFDGLDALSAQLAKDKVSAQILL